MIGQEISHYRILERLGGGGMGVVYKAEDTRLGRTVALKFLNTELLSNESTRRRFLHEARAASLIDHPNVCHVYEVGEADGRAFMAMSYCEGRSLRDVINAGPVPPREAFSIAFGIAQGLWAAHRRGVVHRDIKPANVLLGDDGLVRVVDFGLALLTGHSRVTTSGVTVGTVAYMSPEQTADSDVGPNTDIWSLGVTLYEMLTGRLPFRGEINAALVYSIVHEPPIPLSEVNSSAPPQCARIIERCLQKDPAQRYQTIEELLEDMVRAARELGWDASVASATIAPILRERRKKVLARRVAVVAAAVIVLAGGYLAYRKLVPPPSPYVTKIRLAVMPLDNMIGADQAQLVDGISEHLSRASRWVNPGPGNGSMWMVPFNTVLKADLPKPADARTAFGANRAIVGNVQRFEDAYRVNLALIDTRSGRQLAAEAVPYSIVRMNALPETLMVATARLLGVDVPARASPWRCAVARAATAYFETMPMLRKTDDEALMKTAVELLDEAASRDPSFAAVVCADGSARLLLAKRTRDATLAASALERAYAARTVAPRLTEASVLLGDAFVRAQSPDSAERWYRHAAAGEPGFSNAARQLARFYVDQKRVDEAEQTYRQVIAIHPDLAVAHRDLGNFFFERDRLDDAAQQYRRALALAPAEAIALNNLGAVLHRQGNWPVAHDMFLRSFKVRPDCFSSSNVAVTLYFQRKFAESAKYYEFALEHCDTTKHGPWGNLARALYWAPNGRDGALMNFRKALAIARADLDEHPDDVDMMANVIDYEAMTGNENEARALIERIRPLLNDNERAMYRVGTVCEKLGQREAALDLIGNAIRHGFPLPEIKGDPMLENFVTDPVFLAMVRSEAAAEEAQAAGQKP